jgi:hypothetical protein
LKVLSPLKITNKVPPFAGDIISFNQLTVNLKRIL